MIIQTSAIVREGIYLFILLALGLVLTPFLFYEDSTLESVWGDTTFTVAAFEKYWDDLVRYREFKKVWWKILIPCFAYTFVRGLIWSARTFKKKRDKTIP
jgi:Ni,Fe-hydrogenase I cytochrome b subunit